MAKRGRPAFNPTDQDRETVLKLVGYGIPEYDICRVIGISSPMTLRKYFWTEIETGKAVANSAVAASLFQKAIGPGKEGVTAAIFWLKCRAGWREKDNEQQPGKKEQAQMVAQTAERGTDWESILN